MNHGFEPEGAEESKPASDGEELPRSRKWLATGLPALGASLIALVFGLSFGYNYGVSNQLAYLIGGLRMHDPELWARDWYVQETTQYHGRFDYVVWALDAFGDSGWPVAYANVAVIALGAMAVYGLMVAVADSKRAFPAFLLWAMLAMLTQTRSVAVSYLFDEIFQPSTLASACLLGAIALYVYKKPLGSGLMLAVAGLFHANYAVLGIPVFALAHLLQGRGELGRRLLAQLLIPALLMAVLLPVVLRASGAGDVEAGRQILFTIRAPHHYDTKSYIHGFGWCLGWQTLGLGAGWHLMRKGDGWSPLGAVFVSLAAAFWSGSVLTTVWQLDSVRQAFVWRLAPFIEALALAMAALAAIDVVRDHRAVKRYAGAPAAAVLAGLSFLCVRFSAEKTTELVDHTVYVAGAVAAGWLVVRVGAFAAARLRLARLAAPLLAYAWGAAITLSCAYLWYQGVKPPLDELERRSNLLRGERGATADLQTWARTETPKDSVFLVPPDLSTFRFWARRAIVVDWKSAPMIPGELALWHKRMNDVSGGISVRGPRQARTGYERMDKKKMLELRERYHVDMVVLRKGQLGRLGGFPVLYQNGQYAVLDLR